MGSRKLLIITTALTFLLSTLSPANANNPPRKILSGWLPDYSLARNLPTVEGNLDLIRDEKFKIIATDLNIKNPSIDQIAILFDSIFRKISVSELVASSKAGTLREMFGAGTAAVVSPISTFGFRGIDYHIPEFDNTYADLLKNRITAIQTNKVEDNYGWRVKI